MNEMNEFKEQLNRLSEGMKGKLHVLFEMLNGREISLSKPKVLFPVIEEVDENNHYLIRLLNFKDSAKIYVFSTTEEVLKNYQIVIKPSGQTFEQDDNSKPIEVKFPLAAENIELHFI